MGDTAQKQILAAGAVAAFTVDLLVYPLDTIKTRYQSRVSYGKNTPYQAARGLYQGIGSVVLATLPAAAIFFASYESATSLLRGAFPSSAPDPVIHALASAGAEMASCMVLTPAEVIKQNAQVLRESDSRPLGRSSSLRALHRLRHSEGGAARTLWRGYAVLVARNLPFTAIHFPMFEFFRGFLWERRQDHWPSASSALAPNAADVRWPQRTIRSKVERDGLRPLLVETGLVTGSAAAGSGALAAIITTPADVVKTRVMLWAGTPSDTWPKENDYTAGSAKRSAVGVAKVIFRDSGIRGLFRGATLRAAWASLGSGLYLGSYEVTKSWLKHRSA